MIHQQRLKHLNDKDARKGKYVLYWMQQSQRSQCNHALEYAIRQADNLKLPVVVIFGITPRYPEANERHYAFMLEGLRETRRTLEKRGIRLLVRVEHPREAVVNLAADAALVVADRGYLRFQREWRTHAARRVPCKMIQVESDIIVPVEVASEKEEYAARTLRGKIHKRLNNFMEPLEESAPKRGSLDFCGDSLKLDEIDEVLESLKVNRGASPVRSFTGGSTNARKLLETFISEKLSTYADERNDPSKDTASHMSPYLHFGQISPLEVAMRVSHAKTGSKKNKDAYLEELIVRRELSINFCYYNPRYDSFECLPAWALETLRQRKKDKREYSYSLEQLEQARTHDPYWNAAQNEMTQCGKMQNYMRMYWGKKILEWSSDPENAFRTALYLNNKYELDGRDPNSFAGVAWCFGKHDRPWTRRKIFGTVRYMNAAGLERKFDMDGYIEKTKSARR